MSTIGVFAKLTAKPGQRDQLAAAMKPLLDSTNDEPGTQVYVLHADNAEPDVLWMYERYDDQAALDAHSASPTFKATGKELAPFLAGRPELHLCSIVGGKGA